MGEQEESNRDRSRPPAERDRVARTQRPLKAAIQQANERLEKILKVRLDFPAIGFGLLSEFEADAQYALNGVRLLSLGSHFSVCLKYFKSGGA